MTRSWSLAGGPDPVPTADDPGRADGPPVQLATVRLLHDEHFAVFADAQVVGRLRRLGYLPGPAQVLVLALEQIEMLHAADAAGTAREPGRTRVDPVHGLTALVLDLGHLLPF